MSIRRRITTAVVALALATGGMLLGAGIGEANPREAPVGTTGSALQSARFIQSVRDVLLLPDGQTHQSMPQNLFRTGSGGEYCWYDGSGFGQTVCW